MTASTVVSTRLLEMAAVTALVGTRIRDLKLRQGEAQAGAIRVQGVGALQTMHLRGSVTLVRARVQVDSYAPETSGVDPYALAASIAAAAHGDGAGSGLCGFVGTVGGSPGVDVTSILPAPEGPREEYDAEELRVVRISRDYFVKWRT